MPTMTRHRRAVASSWRRRPVVLVTAGLALLLAVAGGACSSSSSSGSTTSTTAAISTTTATSTTADAEAAVRQTLEGWERAYSGAAANPAGDHHELLRYGTAEFVRRQHTYFDTLIRDGQRAVAPADSKQMLKVLSVTINGSRSTARTCFVADLNMVDSRSGAFVDRQSATTTATWELERTGNRWLINNSNLQDESPAVQPCPAS